MTAVKRNKLIALLLVLAILGATVFSATYAWLAGSNIIKSTVTGGSILTSYFHTGDGSEENPFVITRPLHFYNMIYLYQRLEGFADEGYYFQLGYQLRYDEDDAEPDENYYFYRYGDDGKIIAGQYSNVLNMEYYNDGDGMGGALLPVGTSNVPFVGTFDGKGLTVANLHITATETIGNETLGTSDVGIFGYVDETATIKDTYFNGVTIDLTGLDPAVTTADDAHDDTHHDEDKDGTADLSYVGYLAGHIKTSSIVQNVYLNDCHVIGGASARSGYGFFGCVEKAEGGLVDSLGSEVATLRGGGDNAGFGGSIDMNSVFTRLNGMIGGTAATVRNITSEEIWIDEVGGTIEKRNITYANANAQADGNTVYYHAGINDGSYYMFRRSSSGSWTAIYLYGENTRTNTKTVTTYTLKDEFDEDGLLISIDGTYLNATVSGVSAGNVKGEATIWQLDNAGHLNALLEESTRFATYYLNASANGTLSVSTSATTVWTKTEDQNHEGTLTYTSGGRTWYLSYDGSAWGGYPYDSAYTVSNGANYLGYNGSAVSSVNAANALHFSLEGGKLVTFYNNTLYYLNASAGALSLGTNAGSATAWTENGGVFTYTDANSRVWTLCYNNGWCCVPFTEGFTIANNTNYLGYNGTAVTSTNAANALHFSLEGGKLVTYYNNALRYLNASAGTLSLGTNAGAATSWTKNGGVFTYTDGNGRTWYLSYDGGWHCVPFSSGFTIANNTNYLGYNGTAITSTNAAGALHFSFEDGKIVTYYNNTLYYLTATGGTLSLTTSTPSITWVKGANTLSYTDAGSRTWYLEYVNGTWDLFPAAAGYTIRSGASYFGVGGSNLTQTNQAGAAVFGMDGSKLFTIINGAINYLVGSTDGSGTLSFTTTRANGTDWTYTQGGGTMSYTGGGQTWYLYSVDNAWTVYPGASVSLISQSGNYLGAASNTTVGTDASSWTVGGGNIYTYYNGATRYLVSNGESVGLAASPSDTWTVGSTVTNQNGWYLVYENGWKMTPALSYVLITDGNGNYLNRNGTNAVNNGTSEETATRWYADGNKLYAVSGTTKYYLSGTDTALSVTATAANGSAFTYNGTNKRLTYAYNANTYYVVYDNGWTVNDSYVKGTTISSTSSGTTYYLNINGERTGVETGTNASEATCWSYNGSSGTVSVKINGTTYYLRAELDTNNKYGSTNMTVTTTAGSATTFGYANSRLTCTLNAGGSNRTYSLSLVNGALKLADTGKTYYTIKSGNYFLSLNGSVFTHPTDQNDAVLWEFSNDATPSNRNYTSTTVSTLVSGNTRYLQLGNGSVTLSNSSVTLRYYRRTNYYIYTGTYYLRYYNNNWTTSTSRNDSGTTITRTAVTFTQATVTLTTRNYETAENSAALSGTTTVDSVNALNNVAFAAQNSTTLTFGNVNENVTQTAANTAENVAQTKSAVSENITHTTADADRNGLDYETTRRQHIEKVVENGVASGYPTYFPLRVPKSDEADYDAGDILKASQKNTGYVIAGGNFYDGSTTGTKVGDIRVSEYAISNISGSWDTTEFTVSKIRSGTNYLYLEKDEETETYSIANTTNADLANFWRYENGKLFTAVGKTTYWLTYDNGLKLSETAGVDWTLYNQYSTYRLSYNNNYIKYTGGAWVATTGTSSLTLTLGGITDVYTYDGTLHTLTDAQKTDVYNQAVLQLSETLTGSSNVYGLHFMNSEISEENVTVAESASIFGTTYTDYEFPEDSVDFHVIERGTISFFAGEYFTNNNAFFSLHQVYRYKADDAEVLAGTKKVNDIKHIKQISEIYKHATGGDSVNYVYKFSDNTYSNPDGTYTGANSLADGYTNTPVFRTSWITAPTGLSSGSKRIFFFEIPCNAGEYCLGSVSGKTGAYLIYLDIAANGGEELASAISSTGNDVVTSFQTEFRDAPDTMAHSVILLSYDAPAGSTTSNFSVSVNFDKTSAEALEDPHPSGLYTIDVVNKTGSDLTLYVYLCDDDFNLLTAFPYAYKVHYVNTTTGEEGTYLETTFGDTFQMMAGFTIPSSGEAIEVSYH